MAKRFIDTEIFKKPFVKGLETVYKLFWLYIFTDCDHAGMWQVECDVAAARLGEPIDHNQALEVFGDNIQVINNGAQWFLPGFIEFQYGQLNPDVKAHASVIRILTKYLGAKGIKQFIKGSRTLMDKDKDTDKDMDTDKDQAITLARYLIECIEKFKGKPPVTTVGPSSKAIRTILKKGHGEAHILKTIGWLFDPKGNLARGQYAYQVFSGEALASKFDDIQAAMEKDHPASEQPETDKAVLAGVEEHHRLQTQGSVTDGEYSRLYTKIRDNCGPDGVARVKAEHKKQFGYA